MLINNATNYVDMASDKFSNELDVLCLQLDVIASHIQSDSLYQELLSTPDYHSLAPYTISEISQNVSYLKSLYPDIVDIAFANDLVHWSALFSESDLHTLYEEALMDTVGNLYPISAGSEYSDTILASCQDALQEAAKESSDAEHSLILNRHFSIQMDYSDTAQCYIISAVYIPAISKMLHGMKEQMFLIILLIIVFFMTLLIILYRNLITPLNSFNHMIRKMDKQKTRHLAKPLVENAIQHGIEPSLEKCMLYIGAMLTNEEFIIEIRDDGVGMSPERLAHMQKLLQTRSYDATNYVGITNTNARLKLQYDDAYGITIDSQENDGTVVAIHMPLPQANL